MRTRELLGAAFVLFTALLLWPFLTIANRPVLIAGVPARVVYLFTVWGAIVALLAWVAHRSRGDGAP